MSIKKQYLDEMVDKFISNNDEFREAMMEYQMSVVDCPADDADDMYQFHMDIAEGDMLVALGRRLFGLGLNIKREASKQLENAG